MRFSGSVALITGAGNGIGQEIARRFAAEGATVVLADINAAAGERAAAAIAASGGEALAIPVDVADETQVMALVAQTLKQCGQIDILINNAGVVAHKLLIEMDRATWDRQLAVQLTGPFLLSKYVARKMIERQIAGRIINISSVAALMGRVKGGAHSASKAGLTMLTKVLAMELGSYGITVNAVAPGLVETEAQRDEMNISDEYKQRYLAEVPLGRLGQLADVASTVLFLASPEAAWISGQIQIVDGGMTAGHLSFQGVHDFSMLYGTGVNKGDAQ